MAEIQPARTAIGGNQIDAVRRLKFMELLGTATVTVGENLRMVFDEQNYTITIDSVEPVSEGLSLVTVTVF